MEIFILIAVVLLFGSVIYVTSRQKSKKGPGGGSGTNPGQGPGTQI